MLVLMQSCDSGDIIAVANIQGTEIPDFAALFADWQKEEPEPDSESEFIDWLIERKGWPRETFPAHIMQSVHV